MRGINNIARFVVGISLFLGSCEPKPDSAELLDQLVVYTDYDTSTDFSSYSTYAIPTDTISLYSNATLDKFLTNTNSNSDYPRPIINAIKSNMNDRNFDRTHHLRYQCHGSHTLPRCGGTV